MAEEIIVCTSSSETRVAVIAQGLLQEVFVERLSARGTVGNIYNGKVVRVLPGMQSAFVDIGTQRAAFVHITDLIDSHESVIEGRGSDFQYPPIDQLLHEGQKLLVQISKEPIGTKGARATAKISLASRFLVYMPKADHVGISQRIENEDKREYLLNLIENEARPEEGFIARTAAGWATDDAEIINDAGLLRERWINIQDDSAASGTPTLIYEDLPIQLKVMRDIIGEDTRKIHVNSQSAFKLLKSFLSDFAPDKVQHLELAPENSLLFDMYNVEEQLAKALDRKVILKSGGHLIFDQTEAMTTIDVNTGNFVGKKDVEETMFRTNLEAATVIPRQLRLRGVGGIVIVDFIDMLVEEHQRQILRTLEKGQRNDRASWKISEFSDIGLVEMTRKRTKESLLKMMCQPCEVCSARGHIKSTETVCLEIFREIQRKSVELHKRNFMILASQSVVDRLLDEDSTCIEEISKKLESSIQLQVEISYSQEEFDLVSLATETAR